MTDLYFKRYNLNDIKNTVLLIGKRGIGKTTAIKQIINMLMVREQIDKTFILKTTQHYDDIVNHTKCNTFGNVVSNIDLTKKNIIVIDDSTLIKDILKNKDFTTFFYNARHLNCYIIISQQFPMGMTAEFRANVETTFLFPEDFVSVLKKMHDHYGAIIPTYNAFKQIHFQLANKLGEALVCVNTHSSDLYEKIKFHENF